MENVEIARMLEEVADLLEIQEANPFRIRAYRNAARSLESLPQPVAALLAREGEAGLREVPGIGADLAGKIHEIVDTGTLALLTELSAATPHGVVEMMRIPGVGPKRARLIAAELGVTSVEALSAAAREGRLRAVKGFGPVLEARIAQAAADFRRRTARHPIAEAEAHARAIVEHLKGERGLREVAIAGSLRRRQETVGDVDVLVTADDGDAIARRFVQFPGVRDVQAQGGTRASIVLRTGLQVDLRVVPETSFGAALHYFTGSKAHNIAIRTLGVKKGLKVNEYGVFRGRKQVAGRTEQELYSTFGLPWIPPELREDRGEIDAARQGRLPALVEPGDIRGDLQMHTTATDGKNTLEEMVEACRARGYEYIAITDHSKAVRVAGGLSADGFRRQGRAIDRLQKSIRGITILRSAEVDILDDGSLDLEDDLLAELDLVVVSVHSRFGMPAREMTRRIVTALGHPRVNILAHPTGRLIGRREPYQVDMAAVIRAAHDNGVMLEINAQPDRLDLNDVHVRAAVEAGVRLVVSTDAHRVEELDRMRLGVDQARRGWCEKRHVANTRPLAQFRKLLAKTGP